MPRIVTDRTYRTCGSRATSLRTRLESHGSESCISWACTTISIGSYLLQKQQSAQWDSGRRAQMSWDDFYPDMPHPNSASGCIREKIDRGALLLPDRIRVLADFMRPDSRPKLS